MCQTFDDAWPCCSDRYQAAAVLRVDPNSLRWQARNDPKGLGFPVIVVRSRVYIPREAFIHYMKGGTV